MGIVGKVMSTYDMLTPPTPTFISVCIYSSTNVAASNAATLVLHCECCIVLQRRDCSYCQ